MRIARISPPMSGFGLDMVDRTWLTGQVRFRVVFLNFFFRIVLFPFFPELSFIRLLLPRCFPSSVSFLFVGFLFQICPFQDCTRSDVSFPELPFFRLVLFRSVFVQIGTLLNFFFCNYSYSELPCF